MEKIIKGLHKYFYSVTRIAYFRFPPLVKTGRSKCPAGGKLRNMKYYIPIQYIFK